MEHDYIKFLANKAPRAQASGIEPGPMHDALFDYQRDVVAFCLKQGRAALFLDTGLGKSACTLEWCEQAGKASNGFALILTPLAVAKQFEREAAKFGYEARVIRSQADILPGINICNYDRLDLLDAAAFGAVALDESSILKSFGGSTSRALINTFADTPFRLCATATPAPNDHMELGQHAEFLGIMNSQEMLARWFINDTSTGSQQWRLKKAAVNSFWDWVASWARAAETPADLGYDASRFVLPGMNIIRHQAFGNVQPFDGGLFMDDMSATNMFEIKRQTAENRAKLAAQLVKDSNQCLLRNISSNTTNETKKKSSQEPKANQQETPNTCEHTIPQTNISGEKERQSNKKNTMPQGVKNTPTTKIIEPTQSPFQNDQTAKTQIDTNQKNSKNHLELQNQTMTICSSIKTEHAPYAEREPLELGSTFALTTVMLQEESEGFSVPIATMELENSKTILKTSGEPLTTSMGMKMQPWVLWCDTNNEQEILEKELGSLAISIYGHMSPEMKERLHNDWLDGKAPALITKPSIFGMGVNWQHCARMAYVGRTFSYESFYQSVRRCWRFGQTRPVDVHLVVAEGEDQIGRVIDRKADDHKTMKRAMAAAMKRNNATATTSKIKYNPTHTGRLPSWLTSAA